MKPIASFSSTQFVAAARLQRKIETLQAKLRSLLEGGTQTAVVKGRRKVSRASRLRLAKLTKARWAKARREGRKRL